MCTRGSFLPFNGGFSPAVIFNLVLPWEIHLTSFDNKLKSYQCSPCYVISIMVREAATMISKHVIELAAEFTDAFIWGMFAVVSIESDKSSVFSVGRNIEFLVGCGEGAYSGLNVGMDVVGALEGLADVWIWMQDQYMNAWISYKNKSHGTSILAGKNFIKSLTWTEGDSDGSITGWKNRQMRNFCWKNR